MTETALEQATRLWHETNDRIGVASGNGHPADPHLYAALLDSRAGLWLELGRQRDRSTDLSADRTADIYTVACHYAAILDWQEAARIRFTHRIPTLFPGTMAAHLFLQEADHHSCQACGRPWQIGTDGACEQCPQVLRGISPQSADEISKYPPGKPWTPSGRRDEAADA